jgi:glycosyltransferase involved in cell wall biosynthesis
MKALVSVIMAVYNGEKYIQEAIRSVIRQSYHEWELLVVNDGSTDNSESIIASFDDPRIRIFRQENRGVGSARNLGLIEMRGDFFCFLDADDVFPEHSIKSRLEAFAKGSDALAFVDGRVEERDVSLLKISRGYLPAFKGNPMAPMLRIKDVCYLGQTWMIRVVPGRKYKMREDLTHGEDFLFLLGLARNGGDYDFTTETILLYRRHSASAMTNLDGLNNGYLLTHKEIRSWGEVSIFTSFFFWVKSRKIMFLSYLFDGRSIRKAFKSLFQWA